MIFTIVRIGKDIKVFPYTHRQLLTILSTPFEVLEIHKSRTLALARTKILAKTPRRNKKRSKRPLYAIQAASIARSGSGNTMYGKHHTQLSKDKISTTLKQQWAEFAIKRTKRRPSSIPKPKGIITIKPGVLWWHSPITGKELRSTTCPIGFVRGRNDIHRDNFLFYTRPNRYK